MKRGQPSLVSSPVVGLLRQELCCLSFPGHSMGGKAVPLL